MDIRGELNNRAFAVPGSMTASLGVRIVEADPDRVVAKMEGQTGGRQIGTNLWVGEALEAMAGLAAAVMTETLDENHPDTFLLTHGATSRSVYFFRTSGAESVRAEATWLRRGRSQAIVQVSVIDNDDRELMRMISAHHPYPEPFVFDIVALIPNE